MLSAATLTAVGEADSKIMTMDEEKVGGRWGRMVAWSVVAVLAVSTVYIRMNPSVIRGASACETPCREEGRCQVRDESRGDEICYAAGDEACAESKVCETRGRCHYEPLVQPGECVALTAKDCLGTTDCNEKGRCSLEGNGDCAVSAVGCTRSLACEREGACHLVRGEDDEETCGKKDVADEAWCDAACEQNGACTRRGNECVATSEKDCRNSVACRERGRCALDEELGLCVAGSDEACRTCDECEGDAGCHLLEGGDYCIRQTRPCGRVCRLYGWCEFTEGECVASDDEDCRQSRVCVVNGDCEMDDGICVPGEPGHCRESLGCEVAGRCEWGGLTFFGLDVGLAGDCEVGSAQDCKASLGCERYGRCVTKPAPWCREQPGWWPCTTRVCGAADEISVMPCASRFQMACLEHDRCIRGPQEMENPAEEWIPDDECQKLERATTK